MEQNSDSRIIFLLKTMKKKHIDDTLKRGIFRFDHPSAFNKWADRNAAQFDRWDSHSGYVATHIFFAPILGEKNGNPEYGEVKKLSDKAIVHAQNYSVSHSPICCFRQIEEDEVKIEFDGVDISLGNTVDRIKNEFGHDAFVLAYAPSLIERIAEKNACFYGNVVYRDTLNDYQFKVGKQYQEQVEQLFRKDERYEWQKEFRFALKPTETGPVYIELGSIEDIAISGDIDGLR